MVFGAAFVVELSEMDRRDRKMILPNEAIAKLSLLRLYELQILHEFDNIVASAVSDMVGNEIRPIFVEIALKDLWQAGFVGISEHMNSPGVRLYEINENGVDEVEKDLKDPDSLISHFRRQDTANSVFFDIAPASDRIVNINDNSVLRDEILINIAELRKELSFFIEGSNADLEQRRRIIAELDAGADLIRAPQARVGALWAVLGGVLTYIALEFAGAIIGDFAVKILDQLKLLLGL